MKSVIVLIGIALMMLASIATPCAIVYGIYELVVADIQLEVALWSAAKVWLSMLGAGLLGFVMFAVAEG